MKILVTGNMGYVGPEVLRRFRANFPGARLIGVDLGYFGHCLTGVEALPERYLDVQHLGDVRDVPESLLHGIDAVVHLAAISNDPMGKAFEEVTREVNFRASARLASLARAAGVRAFVFASSCSMYGFAEGTPRTENSPLNPLTAYARSKIETEKVIEDLASEKFVTTSLRFPTACGASDRLRLDLVLNDFVAAAVASGKIHILSDGTPWRPLIDVQDMARAIEWAVRRRADQGGPFLAVNVGRNEWNYQVRQLADCVALQIPGVEVEVNKNAAPDRRSYQVDFSLYSELAPQYLPQVSLEQSIAELKTLLEGMGFAEERFRESQLMRLKVLTRHLERGLLDEELRWTANRSGWTTGNDEVENAF